MAGGMGQQEPWNVQMQSPGPERDPTPVTSWPEQLLGSMESLLGEGIVKKGNELSRVQYSFFGCSM